MGFKVVIPARYASTRLPGKPLVVLGDKSMVQHVYERALASGADEVVVATDDTRIEEAVKAFGARVCMTSVHHASGSDRIAEVAARMEWGDEDILVNLQGDEPLTPSAIVRQVADNLADHPEAVIATLCTPITRAAQLYDPHTVKVVRDARDFALYFSRAPIPWERDALDMEVSPALQVCQRHIGLYAYRVGYLKRFTRMESCALERIECLEQLRAMYHGARIHVDVALQAPGAGVDTQEDVERVEMMLAHAQPR
ncbi:3-deoxy-manno-octulosonate cytidylyltransferase [Ectothiorhodospira haloalkaliphila]|uniref:3-deoxy-manno-octulosonate cytidylyltransferase n=1 Tax=Ectothiorhodospira haloalkaliphila TaxID=421628 RepID=W8KTH2_9GAMM|nr:MULTISPECIES: 3-deoxy-manno-octulosonate cytidylyltransferase [Ectothiorhodospira]AHK78891.1 3-deoxy-manno-octulosonate cytidylyltransferase [Ectothiorhodospira haloalkaliphila]MCG5493135.1 3-deoxy-manno-octulosonate cytidylyltransferase [Ectothiorhodospira variabilis]MCG5497143.1 3-deoxy-manno-octulosonate cytidylyltransferase [Ectothiorhodospira variabilis]MCG5502464.1 3-deoxy-manno-octulosonate cytidylyltransferase [Ectothiorhodospira variabilis]MCG5505770.1 3-deoxy-manno-octulosonate cy